MRCLITGADGFLGANLCRALLAEGHDVVGTSLNRKGHTSLDALGISCRIEYGDVTDPAFVERVISTHEAEWVFHLGAVSIVRVAQTSPERAFRTNVLGTVNVLEACRRLPHVAVVVASSDKAYGYHEQPYTEGMPLLPVAPYEVSKAAADLIAQSYAATYGMRVMVTRCANLYGGGDLNFSRLVPNSCRQAAMGRAPIVHAGSANMIREYLHVEDACRAYVALAEKGEPGPYNVGSLQAASTMVVAARIAQLFEAPAPEVVGKASDFAEIPAQSMNVAKIQRLGWMPRVSLEDGLAQTAGWYAGYLGGPVMHADTPRLAVVR